MNSITQISKNKEFSPLLPTKTHSRQEFKDITTALKTTQQYLNRQGFWLTAASTAWTTLHITLFRKAIEFPLQSFPLGTCFLSVVTIPLIFTAVKTYDSKGFAEKVSHLPEYLAFLKENAITPTAGNLEKTYECFLEQREIKDAVDRLTTLEEKEPTEETTSFIKKFEIPPALQNTAEIARLAQLQRDLDARIDDLS